MTKSLNIQFHMTPDEIVDFVATAAKLQSFDLELERWNPETKCELSHKSAVDKGIRAFGTFDRVWFILKQSGGKPERFMLNVGRKSGGSLRQSQLGARARTSGGYLALKKLAKELRDCTTPGLWVVTESGNVGYIKEFRISAEAAAASRRCEIELTNMIGTQRLSVDPPADSRE